MPGSPQPSSLFSELPWLSTCHHVFAEIPQESCRPMFRHFIKLRTFKNWEIPYKHQDFFLLLTKPEDLEIIDLFSHWAPWSWVEAAVPFEMTEAVCLCLCCCCSVAKSCLTLCNPMNCSAPDFPVLHHLPKFAQIHVHWVSDAIYLIILCWPVLLLYPIFPSIRVFSTESALRVRWPKYWSFSFSISPSNEYPGFILFRLDWFDFLAV